MTIDPIYYQNIPKNTIKTPVNLYIEGNMNHLEQLEIKVFTSVIHLNKI